MAANKHPFHAIDSEDRRQAYAEARGTWITVGVVLTLLVLAGLVYVGRL